MLNVYKALRKYYKTENVLLAPCLGFCTYNLPREKNSVETAIAFCVVYVNDKCRKTELLLFSLAGIATLYDYDRAGRPGKLLTIKNVPIL